MLGMSKSLWKTYWYSVRVFPSDFLTLSLPLLKGVFFFVLELHFDMSLK